MERASRVAGRTRPRRTIGSTRGAVAPDVDGARASSYKQERGGNRARLLGWTRGRRPPARRIAPMSRVRSVSSCSTAKNRAVMRSHIARSGDGDPAPPPFRCTKVHQRPRSWSTSHGDRAHERPEAQTSDPVASEFRKRRTVRRSPAFYYRNPCKSRESDARTRTGDPFITSFGQLSAPVTGSHLQSLPAPDPADRR
jgi:hypothetical protein